MHDATVLAEAYLEQQGVSIRVASRFMPPTRFLKQLGNFLVKCFVGRVSFGTRTTLRRRI